jgi:poly(A) polymerase
VNEGERFDIRLAVEEFKGNVNMYTLWKPGMEIRVSHVKRRNIPDFVFPGGIRPSRPSKVTWVSRSSELKVSGHAQDNSPEGKAVSNGGRKRKQVDDSLETNLLYKCSI